MKICPKCSWENQDEFNFCLGCGCQLSSSEKETSPVDSQASDIAPDSGGVSVSSSSDSSTTFVEDSGVPICSTCGAEVTPGHLFCGQCGSRMEDPPEPKPTAGPEVVAEPTPEPVEVVEESPARLVLLLPNGEEGGSYPVKGEFTQIGRSKGNILFLDDPYVSPLHATFYYDHGQLCVRNENSFNGLFIRLRKKVELQHNDVILLGKQLLRFEEIEMQAEADSALSSSEIPTTPIWGSPYSSYWGRLVQLISGGYEGNSILLGGSQVELGRERGQITFPGDRFISSLHARVSTEEQRFFVEDVGSRNGTFVQIRGEHALAHKDILIIGEQLLRAELST